MKKFLLGFSYLMFLSFELVIFLVGGVYLSKYLNSVYSVGFDWIIATMPLSLVLCGYAVYKFLVLIVKIDSKKTTGD
jgi:hypothetical protein